MRALGALGPALAEGERQEAGQLGGERPEAAAAAAGAGRLGVKVGEDVRHLLGEVGAEARRQDESEERPVGADGGRRPWSGHGHDPFGADDGWSGGRSRFARAIAASRSTRRASARATSRPRRVMR